jgi:hypothetical protein
VDRRTAVGGFGVIGDGVKDIVIVFKLLVAISVRYMLATELPKKVEIDREVLGWKRLGSPFLGVSICLTA